MLRAQEAYPKKRGYIPTLDGWRAIAIALVILHHDQLHHSLGGVGVWLQRYGYRGVDLFFALSGLLICTRLLEEEQLTGTIGLRNFYVRRVFRIQPAALFYLITISLLMLGGALQHAWEGILFGLLLLRNYLPLHWVSRDYYTGHNWSLSVEEHFYLFLPFFLRRVRNHRAGILLSCVVVISLWRYVVSTHPRLQFGWNYIFHTDIAVSGILLSSAVAVLLGYENIRDWCVTWLKPWVVFLVIGIIWFDVDYGDHHHFLTFLTYPILLVSTSLHPASLIGRLLELPPIRYFGRISYSLYLWQMLLFTNSSLAPVTNSRVLAYLQATWLRYPAVLLFAVVSYYLVEKPFIKVGHRFAKSVVPGRGEMESLEGQTEFPLMPAMADK
jgi:peptidoglycan/LPS O-acetylase OafA/YrhL